MSKMKTSRRDFLRKSALGAMAAPLLAQCARGQAPGALGGKKPNVVLLYVDDASFTHFGCFGGPSATPNIDSLADRGMRFDRFYVSSAVCTPSRYGVLTGRHASRSASLTDDYPHGGPVRLTWNTLLSENEPTLADALRQGGYATGMVGKWHLGPEELELNKQRESIDPNTDAGRKTLESIYQRHCETISRNGGFDYVDGIYNTNINALPIPRQLRYHNVEWQAAKAMEFVESNREKPFFLYWATPIIHSPNPLLSIQADERVTPKGFLKDVPDSGMPSRKELLDKLYTYGVIDIREDGAGLL